MQLALNRIWGLLMLLMMLLALGGCSTIAQLGDANAISQSPTKAAAIEPVEPVEPAPQVTEPAPQVEATDASAMVAVEAPESSDTTQINVAETEPEVAAADNAAEPTPEVEVATADLDAINPSIGHISDDFSLVRNTGRPQFVYTFADW